MEKITEFLAMGGYGIYVWPSYIIAAAVIVIMAVVTVRSLRQAQKTLSSLKDYKD